MPTQDGISLVNLDQKQLQRALRAFRQVSTGLIYGDVLIKHSDGTVRATCKSLLLPVLITL